MPELSQTFLIVPLAALAVVAFLLAVTMPVIQGRARRKRRMSEALRLRGGNHGASGSDGNISARRKAIEKTLKEIEERQSARMEQRRRLGLDQRLREAGLDWKPSGYRLLCVAMAIGGFAASFAFGVLIAIGVGLATGLALPHFYIGFLRRRRLNAFAAGFPDVIDVIVRGVRAGRPLPDCLAMVASDAGEPHRSEFRLVVEDHSIGMPLQDAIDRLAQRVPLQEVGFLAVVVAIQSRAGGSLTEALNNLSTVLRGRRQLQAKVKSMSAEAKTSAGIIGSLPIIVAALVQLTSPDYLAALYQTNIGIMVMVASAVWMSIGVFVMRQMINFDM